MKGNDLSNRFSPIIAFKIEGLLLTPPKKKMSWSLFPKKLNTDPFKHWEINNKAVKLIMHLWRHTDYSINLYSINHPLTLESIKKKVDDHVPYSHVFVAEDIIDLREKLDSQYTLYYFTTEQEELSVIGSMAKHIDDLPKLI